MNVFGAALTFFSCTALGIIKARSLTELDKCYSELLYAFEIIKGEIVSRRSTLDKAVQTAAHSSQGSAEGFLKAVPFNKLGEKSLAELWRAAAEQRLGGISPRALSAVIALGGSLGKYDADSQACAIDRCCGEITAEQKQLRAFLGANRRMYTGIGAAAGLITVIVLL